MSGFGEEKRIESRGELEQDKICRRSVDQGKPPSEGRHTITNSEIYLDGYPSHLPNQGSPPYHDGQMTTYREGIEDSSDETEDIEQLERQVEKARQKLADAHRARLRRQIPNGTRVSQDLRGYLPTAPSSPDRLSIGRRHSGTPRSNHVDSSTGPGQAGVVPPPLNFSTKPRVSSDSFLSSLNQSSKGQDENPSSGRQSKSHLHDTKSLSFKDSSEVLYPTVPRFGKRHRDELSSTNEIDGTEDNRPVQKRKLNDGRSKADSRLPACDSDQVQIAHEGHLPSSDGVDLLDFHPPHPKPSARPEQHSGPHVDPFGSGDPLSLFRKDDCSGGSIPNFDSSSGVDPWYLSWDSMLNAPVLPWQGLSGYNPLTDAQFASLLQPAGHQSGGAALAGTSVQRNNVYRPSQYSTTPHIGKRERDDITSSPPEQDRSSAASEEPQSKRQKRRQRLAKQGVELGSDNKKKGVILHDANGLFYQLDGKWVPAAYHNDRRHILLERTDRIGRYKYSSEHGAADHDRMAYHAEYANFDMKVRNMRPSILYQWNAPEKKQTSQTPNFMVDEADGRLLLDINNHPIRDWPELPVCISGQVEGIWMEYWRRLNPNISVPDIVARCPKETQKHAGLKKSGRSIAAYSNRMRRERVLLGTIAWDPREGSREIAGRLKELMPRRVLAQLEHENSTKSWRDLTHDEIDAVQSINHGKVSNYSYRFYP